MLAIFLATYGAVFIAEIVGDKLLYTTGILATRFRAISVLLGMGLAFAAKMGVAVAVGEAISRLPHWLVAVITATSFIGIAITIWRKPVKTREKKENEAVAKGALVAFAAIFFSEWGDIGQITAATMAARYPTQLLVVWLGAVGAMVTKGTLAASLGAGLRAWIRERIPAPVIRYGGVALLLVLGTLSVIESALGHDPF